MSNKVQYGEETFKNSNWTMFQQGSAGGKRLSPWDHIIIQAPLGVACDVMRNGFELDPYGVHCAHCGEDFSIYEDMERSPDFLFQYPGHHSIFIVCGDAVPYYASGNWKVKDQFLKDWTK